MQYKLWEIDKSPLNKSDRIITQTGDCKYNFANRELKLELADDMIVFYIDGIFGFEFESKYWNLFVMLVMNRNLANWQSGYVPSPFNNMGEFKRTMKQIDSTALFQLFLATVETTNILNLVNGKEEEFKLSYDYLVGKFIGFGKNGLYYLDDILPCYKELVSKNQLCQMDIIGENFDKTLYYVPYATPVQYSGLLFPTKNFELSKEAKDTLVNIKNNYNKARG